MLYESVSSTACQLSNGITDTSCASFSGVSSVTLLGTVVAPPSVVNDHISDQSPEPTSFTPRTRQKYWVPVANSPTSNCVNVIPEKSVSSVEKSDDSET